MAYELSYATLACKCYIRAISNVYIFSKKSKDLYQIEKRGFL
jgi:hypothetical protein